MASLAESARQRIREEMERKGITTRELADLLNTSQGRIGHLLTGYTDLRVDDLEQLCFGVGLSPVEAIRDRGLEFCATMTPTQLRILQRIQQLPEAETAILTLLDVKRHTAPEGRHATPKGRKKAPEKKKASGEHSK